MSTSKKITGALVATALMLPGTIASPAMAAGSDAVATLAGTWSGNGRLRYADGHAENIHCSANYTGGGSELRMAIQCKSDTNPIHLRSKLRIDGGRASGEWEERTFNASGSASGSAGPGSLKLSVSGGGFNGSMSVTFSKRSHTVSISTQGIAMSGATINFSR